VRKKSIKNSQPFVKKMKNVMSSGGFVFDSHCTLYLSIPVTSGNVSQITQWHQLNWNFI